MIPPKSRTPESAFTLVEERHDSPLGRWTIVLAIPTGPLAHLVEAVWTSRGEGVFTQEEILPRTPTEVLFALGETHWLRDRSDPTRDRAYTRAFVSGLQTRPLAVESPADAEMAGVRLKPEGAAAVERQLADAAGPVAPLRFALEQIRASRGTIPIGALVAASGWSHRHFADRFRAEVGLTPKAYSRIARFEAAFARLQSLARPNWAEFALDCGYFDQAHLIRDFGELAGATPTEIVRRMAPDGLGLLDEEELQARS